MKQKKINRETCGLSLRTLVKEYLLSPKQQINEPTKTHTKKETKNKNTERVREMKNTEIKNI